MHSSGLQPPVDFLVLGGGSAGCVLADRLSESGRYEVLLVEAGPEDRNPFIHVPAGFLRLLEVVPRRVVYESCSRKAGICAQLITAESLAG